METETPALRRRAEKRGDLYETKTGLPGNGSGPADGFCRRLLRRGPTSILRPGGGLGRGTRHHYRDDGIHLLPESGLYQRTNSHVPLEGRRFPGAGEPGESLCGRDLGHEPGFLQGHSLGQRKRRDRKQPGGGPLRPVQPLYPQRDRAFSLALCWKPCAVVFSPV